MRILLFIPLIFIIAVSLGCSKDSTPSQNSPSSNQITIATSDDPLSLDPRLVRDLATATVMRMLFEGLMRTNSKGILEPACAQEVAISEDQTIFTFILRPCMWSDGTAVTAEDFAETWKSALKPDFPAPNAYQFYLIKGAKDAKEGRAPPDQIGIKAESPNTLVVELEQPAPYFLELVACHFYFPVNRTMRLSNEPITGNIIGNGPFKYENWQHRHEFSVVKNPDYWDAKSIQIDKIILQVLEEHTALQLFKIGQIDWTGSPLNTLPQDAIEILKEQNILKVAPGAGTHWFRFNTERLPFTNQKMRQAFSLALDRHAIVEHVTQGNQSPATGILPPSLEIDNQQYYEDHDLGKANMLFSEALDELGFSRDQMTPITLHYTANDRSHKIAQAVQQQWNTLSNVPITLESGESKVTYDRLNRKDYQICLGSWYADILDPINFLEIFKDKDNPTNQTSWQNETYARLLDQSSKETNPQKRLQLFNAAERILIEEMPIAPLFYASFNYLKKESLENVYFSPLGYLDFKEAYWQPHAMEK